MATEEAINKLKAAWLADPCWDIETTEGFEDHIEELKQFRLENEARWDKKRMERKELEKNKTFQQRVEELRQDIKASDYRIGQMEEHDLNAQRHQLEPMAIGLMQIKATLLLAEQVNVVVDLLTPLTKSMMFFVNKDDDRDGLAESVRIWGSGS